MKLPQVRGKQYLAQSTLWYLGKAMYTPQVLEHFNNPRNSGELPEASAVVEVSNPACGDVLQLSAKVENRAFAAVRFKATGCSTAVACGSILTEMLPGRTLDEADHLTAEMIAASLGGLPEATYHGSQLAVDALKALLQKCK